MGQGLGRRSSASAHPQVVEAPAHPARRLAAVAVRQEPQGEGRADGGEAGEVAPAEEGQHGPLRDEYAEYNESNLCRRFGQPAARGSQGSGRARTSSP